MSKLEYTSLDEIPKIHELLRAGFKSGKTRPVAYRKHQLLQLAYLLKDNRQRFRDAFSADFKRPYEESDMLEIDPSIGCVVEAYDSVAKWAARERAPFDQLWFAMSPAIRKEPRGTVLVVAPFNYPVLLLVNGFVGAIAAGCTVLLKPSELVPSISGLLAELLPQYLDQDLYRIVNGAVPEMTKILELKWDHIFYTGGGRVAQIISIAAAKHLTPLTLELGGKSPVVIDPGCDLNVAARRILWGKTINAGQVCLAPDYALVPKDFQDTFVAAMQRAFNEFFPTESPRPGVMSCIVSQQHASRLKRLVDETKGTIVFGGQVDVEQQFISPTVVKDVAGDDVLMSEEIFGPILPVVPVKDVDEAIEFINARDSPLALYVFSRDSAFKAKVFDNTQSGMAVANEVVIGMAVHGVPFGGTGASGHGYSTGKWSFDAFTHLRATFDNPSWVDTLIFNRRYPPYSRGAIQTLIKSLQRSLPPRPGTRVSIWKRWRLWFAVGIAGLLAKFGWKAVASRA